jgi:transcriptional regulator with XRE-family HTH domain
MLRMLYDSCMQHEEEVERITRLLRDAIKLSKRSNREVEKKLGMSGGYLSRLFAGVMDLRMEHVLAICNAIDFPVAQFFRAAYPLQESEDPRGSNLQQALSRLHPPPAAAPAERPLAEPAAAAPSEEQIERMLLSALRKLLGEQANKS